MDKAKFGDEFKRYAVVQITERDYPIAEVSKCLGISQHSLYAWKRNFVKSSGTGDDDQAAEILGIPQPKLSGMLRGQFRGISEAKMLECMNRLGRDVEIVVRKPSRSGAMGRTSVIFA